MELKEYIRFLKKWIWVIFAVTFFSVLIIWIFSYFVLEREYKAETTILVGDIKIKQEDNRDIYVNIPTDENIIKVYSALAKSDSVLDKIIVENNLNIKTEELRKSIKVEPYEDTGIIKITVNNKSADNAKKIINSILSNLQYESNKINLPGKINIIDTVKTPVSPSKPNYSLNIFIACILGIMGGMILAGILEVMDNSLINLKDFEKNYDVPILGFITKISKYRKNNYISEELTCADETYKIITRLNSLLINEDLKVILVTSPNYKEGKTTVALKTAESLGNLGKRVLLINCDFRNSTLNKDYYLVNDNGLSDYLLEDIDTPMVIPLPDSNLYVITNGTKQINPIVLLQSPRMAKFIENMKEKYDYILIDSPPLLPVADASILSKLSDGIMMVVKYRYSKHEQISRALQNLKKFNANILGVVVNQTPKNI